MHSLESVTVMVYKLFPGNRVATPDVLCHVLVSSIHSLSPPPSPPLIWIILPLSLS